MCESGSSTILLEKNDIQTPLDDGSLKSSIYKVYSDQISSTPTSCQVRQFSTKYVSGYENISPNATEDAPVSPLR